MLRVQLSNWLSLYRRVVPGSEQPGGRATFYRRDRIVQSGASIWLDISVWLCGVLSVWGGVASLLVGTAIRKLTRWWLWAVGAILLYGTVLTSVDAAEWLTKQVASAQLVSWIWTAAPIMTLGLLAIPFRLAMRIGSCTPSNRWAVYGLLIWTTGLSSWITYRYFVVMRGDATITVEDFSVSLVPVEGTYLRTDQGHLIPVFTCALDIATEECQDSPAVMTSGFVIRREPPNPRYNCHGWVFGAGSFVLKARDVETILADNGYYEVSRPDVGDIVVYRDDQGRIIHTAVVRGILDDGTPLLESKWGFGGRFLHRPHEQAYSLNYSYLRTRRPARGTGILARHWLDVVHTTSS